jgi:DNA-binding MarR family transcriptional regulator
LIVVRYRMPWRARARLSAARRCPSGEMHVNDRSARTAEDRDGGGAVTGPNQRDFENLLAFRVALRRFQRWSEDRAGAVGLTHVQHQLLVAIKGHPGPAPPSVGQIADYLLLQSHSAVGLVDRAEAAGFVRRCPDPGDGRVARVELTGTGDRLVTELTEATLAEMHKLAAALNALIAAGQQAVLPALALRPAGRASLPGGPPPAGTRWAPASRRGSPGPSRPPGPSATGGSRARTPRTRGPEDQRASDVAGRSLRTSPSAVPAGRPTIER